MSYIATARSSPDTISLFTDSMTPLNIHRDGSNMTIDGDRMWEIAQTIDLGNDDYQYAKTARHILANLARQQYKRSPYTTKRHLYQCHFEAMADLFLATYKTGLDNDAYWDKVIKRYLKRLEKASQ